MFIERRKCLEKKNGECEIRGWGEVREREMEREGGYEISRFIRIYFFQFKKIKFLGYRIKNKNIFFKEVVKLGGLVKNLSIFVIFFVLLGLVDYFFGVYGVSKVFVE